MPRKSRPPIRLLQMLPSEVPPPPTGLLKSSRDAWANYWSSPVARLADPVADLPALTRLFRLHDELHRAMRVLPDRRLVAGYNGQPRPNPMYRVAAALQSEIRQLEDRFGLSPRSRLELGAVAGQASRSLADLNAQLEAEPVADMPDPRIVVIGGPVS